MFDEVEGLVHHALLQKFRSEIKNAGAWMGAATLGFVSGLMAPTVGSAIFYAGIGGGIGGYVGRGLTDANLES